MGTRRKFLKHSLAGAAAGTIPLPIHAAIQTPAATEGPFYPLDHMRFADIDNDLVKIVGKVMQAGGKIIRLHGRVFDAIGEPVGGARVEIWQCDINGRYLHPGDNQTVDRDRAFQGFGHDITDPEGRYEFRTIRPVSYPGRTPHIHVKVFHDNQVLTTQFYLADEPQNPDDALYRRMTPPQQRAVEMRFTAGTAHPEAEVDIHL